MALGKCAISASKKGMPAINKFRENFYPKNDIDQMTFSIKEEEVCK